jgi:hypothetical protein
MTGSLIITGFELRTTTSGSGIYATYGAKVSILKLKFGQIASGFIAADFGAQINCLSTTLEIAGTNPTAGLHANLYGRIYIFDTVITFDAGVTLPYFAGCAEFGAIMLFSVTYSGTFTGAKYLVHNGGILETDATLPGSLAGTVENFSGGYYIQSGASVAPPPTAFTAIPTSAGGAFTSATGSGHWKNTGTGYVAFDYTMTITTVGPANTFTSVTLPFITARDTCIPFRLSLVSFVGFIQAGSNQMYLTKFDGSFGLVNGSVVVGGGVVEVLRWHLTPRSNSNSLRPFPATRDHRDRRDCPQQCRDHRDQSVLRGHRADQVVHSCKLALVLLLATCRTRYARELASRTSGP